MKAMYIVSLLFLILSFAGCEIAEVDLKEQFIGDWAYLDYYNGKCSQRRFFTFSANDTLYVENFDDNTISKTAYTVVSASRLDVKLPITNEYIPHDYQFLSDDTIRLEIPVPSFSIWPWDDDKGLLLIRKSLCK